MQSKETRGETRKTGRRKGRREREGRGRESDPSELFIFVRIFVRIFVLVLSSIIALRFVVEIFQRNEVLDEFYRVVEEIRVKFGPFLQHRVASRGEEFVGKEGVEDVDEAFGEDSVLGREDEAERGGRARRGDEL